MAYYSHRLKLDAQTGFDDLESLDRNFAGEPARLLATWMGLISDAPDEIAQGRVLAPIRQLASWFAEHYGLDNAVVDIFLKTFLAEVVIYFDEDQAARRAGARAEVTAALDTHRPRIVIAHSLGSVIAYECLWADPEIQLELLITVGSPLGMPNVIFERLEPAVTNRQGARPPGVAHWVNIADPADIVAIPRHLRKRFRKLDVDLEVSAGAFFTHKAQAYLSCAVVRDLVRTHLDQPRR
jgi:hypothetical protein